VSRVSKYLTDKSHVKMADREILNYKYKYTLTYYRDIKTRTVIDIEQYGTGQRNIKGRDVIDIGKSQLLCHWETQN